MKKYIQDNGKAAEDELNAFLEKYKSDDSLLFCVYTDRFCCKAYKPLEDTAHALEIRLFDEKGEFKAVRGNIGRDFVWRYISDDNLSGDDENEYTYDELQYLDIDDKKTSGTSYVSIGGGEYKMPAADYERILIRHYGDYDEDGMFGLKDFRLVKFLRKGEK